MDFAASLIAIIGLADKVISRCHRYLSAVKDCPSDLRRILIETSSVKSIVENLEFLYRNSPDQRLRPFFLGLDAEAGPIRGCRECLQNLEALLPADAVAIPTGPTRSGGKRRSIQPTLERLAWPLRQTKAKKLLDDLSRFRAAISLALVTDSHGLMQRVNSRVNLIWDRLDENSREKILTWLVKTDPSPLHNKSCALREQHTGLWLHRLPEYVNWREGRLSMLWFYGIPGAGKTVLFSHIVEETKAQCKAQSDKTWVCIYYYCYFGRNQDETGPFLRWAVSQLARHARHVPEAVSTYYGSGEEPSVPALLDALTDLASRFGRIYLLVDALDESKPRAELLRMFQRLNTGTFGNIKTLVMSREEADIKSAFKDLAAHVSLSNSYVDQDIAFYIDGELATNPRLQTHPDKLKQEIRAGLVKGARGMFRWAACQIEILSKLHRAADIRQALRDLPKTLDATYERILLNIPEEHRLTAKKALLLIAAERSSSTTLQPLMEAVTVDLERQTYNPADKELLPVGVLADICTCLVRFDEKGPYGGRARLAHYTVQEYLYSERLKSSDVGYFHCSPEPSAFTKPTTSAIYLLSIPYTDFPSLLEFEAASSEQQEHYRNTIETSFPFLGLAMGNWLIWDMDISDSHLRGQIEDLFIKLFFPGRHFRWWEWRATDNRDHVHPLWIDYDISMGPHVALTIACFFSATRLVERILDDNPMLLCDKRQMILHPGYARWVIDHYSGDRYLFPDLDPPEWLPGGTLLEVVLQFNFTKCTKTVASRTPNLGEYVSSLGFSPLSIALRSIEFEDASIIRDLLHAGASVNPHHVCETPLQSAARRLEVKVILLLLRAGALVNQVADDDAVIQHIREKYAGNPEEMAEAISQRGFRNSYKTPLLIVLERMEKEGERDFGAAGVLRDHGGLPLNLFPVPGLPGYCAEHWRVFEEGSRSQGSSEHSNEESPDAVQ